jgi:hypothetical protein
VVAAVLAKVIDAAAHTRASAQTVLEGSHSVESAVADLRSEVETFLSKVVG